MTTALLCLAIGYVLGFAVAHRMMWKRQQRLQRELAQQIAATKAAMNMFGARGVLINSLVQAAHRQQARDNGTIFTEPHP